MPLFKDTRCHPEEPGRKQEHLEGKSAANKNRNGSVTGFHDDNGATTEEPQSDNRTRRFEAPMDGGWGWLIVVCEKIFVMHHSLL